MTPNAQTITFIAFSNDFSISLTPSASLYACFYISLALYFPYRLPPEPSTEERRLTMLEFDEETHQALMDACLDDSTKIIRYMEEKEKQSRPYNLTMLILALISAIGGTIAAITSVITYFSQLS